jgi:hypothetical protein
LTIEVVVSPALSAAEIAILPFDAVVGKMSIVPAVPDAPASRLVVTMAGMVFVPLTVCAPSVITKEAEAPASGIV